MHTERHKEKWTQTGGGLCKTLVLLAIGTIWLATTAQAQRTPVPTRVTVRAVSHDAKIIGSGVGGARIVITHSETGEVLAQGIQEGGTGDTGRIVVASRDRDAAVYDTEGAAQFTATVSIAAPTVVDITAYGPLDAESFVPRSSKRMLLLPGQDVLGEGVILELNGFTVELLESERKDDERVSVLVRVTMLCGCPTEPGGLWDADDIRVTARLLAGDRVVSESDLSFAGTTSTYAATLSAPGAGPFDLEVTASEPSEGNFGMVKRTVRY